MVLVRRKSCALSRRCQRGVSLIEILVTLIILAIGFLGMASVQLLGAKNIASSNYRTLATIYTYDMAERMRSNTVGVGMNVYQDTNWDSVSDPNCGSTCGEADVARRDAYEWSQLIADNLPNGKGEVTYVSSDDIYNVTVSWSEVEQSATGPDSVTQSFVLAVKI